MVQYSAAAGWDGASQQGGYCGYLVNREAYSAYHVVEPVEIARSGQQFRGVIAEDKYLPGRCKWRFDSIGYKVLNGVGDLSEDWLANVYLAQRDEARAKQLPQGPVAEWCKKDNNPADPTFPERCSNLSVISKVAPLSPNLIAKISSADRSMHYRSWIFPETSTLKITFHDLDQME